METITSKHLMDDANHTGCECGNKTIHEYVWSDDNGNQSCPLCMVDWQRSQIKAMKELVYSITRMPKEKVAEKINEKYAEIMEIRRDEFDEDMDFSKIN